jgi:hypothetical protein
MIKNIILLLLLSLLVYIIVHSDSFSKESIDSSIIDFQVNTTDDAKNILAELYKQRDDIKSRFPIQFKVGNITTTSNKIPSVNVEGQLPEINLNISFPLPPQGDTGPNGIDGGVGPTGPTGATGPKGPDYYGSYGPI